MFAPLENTAKEETPQRDLLLSGIPGRETTFEATEKELLEKLNGVTDGAIVLDFETTVEETLRENIPYKTEYVTDDDAYEGQEIVEQKGRDGRASNTYRVTFTNGVETGRVLISQKITRDTVNEVIRVGTRTLPETMSEEENGGKYMINPVPSAYVSSRFGWRVLNGKSDHHDGLDLAALQGETIYAAASGEVIFAGYNSSYGNHVKIRHADGKITLYGHCYKLYVKVGDTVVQAQKIAEVGNTGYSFGNHCHFEVYLNGERVNPEKYLYSLD
jgi:murein DD-endopeptidase MepM/ murein hydrolase activator NlpD